MRILSFGAVFMYLEQTIVGILQGLGQTRTVFINNFLGSAAKLIGMYYCIRILGWGSNGIAGGMVLGYGLQCLLNLAMLARKVQFGLSWKEMLLPVAGSFFMLWVIGLGTSVWHTGSAVGFLLAMAAGGLSYLLVLLATGQLALFLNGLGKEKQQN